MTEELFRRDSYLKSCDATVVDVRDEGVVLDCGGRAAIPGFVDSHTHLAFGGDRGDEFVQRLAGADYEEILAAGGGILSTVRANRATGLDDLTNATTDRVRRMASYGTTTVEVKSGYGLEAGTEARQLQAAAAAGVAAGIDVVPPFSAPTSSPSTAWTIERHTSAMWPDR